MVMEVILKSTNIHQFIAYLQLISFSLIGLAPVSLNRLTTIPQKKKNIPSLIITNSRAIVSYHLLLILSVLFFNIFRAWIGAADLSGESATTVTLTLCLYHGFMWLAMIILIIYYIKRSAIKDLANRLINFECNKINFVDVYHSRISKCRSYLYYFIYMVNAITTVTIHGVLEEFTYNWFGNAFSFFLVSFFVIQYALLLNIVRDRFDALNRALRIYFETFEEKEQFNSPALIQNQLIVCDSSHLPLIKIVHAHEFLYEICQQISELYAFPTFLAIAAISYAILMNAYWSLLAYVMSDWQDNVLGTSMGAISWLLMLALPIIALTTTVTGISTEVCYYYKNNKNNN